MTEFAEKYGPHAVVTGAAAGVGLAFAQELAARGVGVVMVDISPEVVDVAAALDGNGHPVVVDVSDPSWIDTLEAETSDLQIGLVVANAGISFVGRFIEMSVAQRRRMIEINCTSTTELAAWALPKLVARGGGGYIAMSSGSALAGTAGVGLYSATKAFAINLVEAIGWEMREENIDTLAVVAPSMDTPGFLSGKADPDLMAAPSVDPRTVVSGALDALAVGGRWLADPGLEFAAAVDRTDRVDMMGAATTSMYPHLWPKGG